MVTMYILSGMKLRYTYAHIGTSINSLSNKRCVALAIKSRRATKGNREKNRSLKGKLMNQLSQVQRAL